MAHMPVDAHQRRWRSVTNDDHLATLPEAALAQLDGALLGDERLPQSVLDVLLSAGPMQLKTMEHDERRITGAAMLLAWARHKSAAEVIDLIAQETAASVVRKDAPIPPHSRSTFWASVSEAYLMVAMTRKANQAGQVALQYANEVHSEALVYRAHGLIAASYALNGEYSLADAHLFEAAQLEQRHRWQLAPAAHPALIAQVMIAAARQDVMGLARCMRRLEQLEGQVGPAKRAMLDLIQALRHFIEGSVCESLGMITKLVNGAAEASLPPLLRAFLVGFQSILLVAKGEPFRALAVLEERSSPADHTVCYDLQRASALLAVGQDREVLKATTGCIRMGPRHCLRNLSAIQFRRAIAHERLGNAKAADSAFSEGFHLLRGMDAFPLMTLPKDEVAVLLRRLETHRADLGPLVNNALKTIQNNPLPEVGIPMPALTEREALIAHHLRGDQTLSGIAATLFVSRNTVKTQTSSLYRKLGANSRSEAVDKLEGMGFFRKSSGA